MPAVVYAALGLLLLVGAYLLRIEWSRFKADRSPAPPPSPEVAALDRWNAGVAMLIAGISIVGALLAWWASTTFDAASSLDQQALQQMTQYQTTKAVQDSYINLGARLSEAFQEHTVAESNLYTQAGWARKAGNLPQALQLEAQARVEGAEERALYPGFVGYWASLPNAKGDVGYSRAQQEAYAYETVTDLRTLDAEHVAALNGSARSLRAKGQRILLAGALLIMAVFFLTVSYLGWKHRRVHTLAPGVLAMAAALAVLVVAGIG